MKLIFDNLSTLIITCKEFILHYLQSKQRYFNITSLKVKIFFPDICVVTKPNKIIEKSCSDN